MHNISSHIIFENNDFIVINKPSGMLSIPDRVQSEVSLKDILKEKYGNIYTIHRLDKDTSGVIVFAKNEAAHKELSQLFESREVEKIYTGLVHGTPSNAESVIEVAMMEHPVKKGKMVTHVKGKNAITEYKVLENFKLFSWMQFKIHTGRTHQIRVHMQYIGNTIVCDNLYGSDEPILLSKLKRRFNLSKKDETEKPLLGRLALHAQTLRFRFNDNPFYFHAELPKDLKATLQQLRKVN